MSFVFHMYGVLFSVCTMFYEAILFLYDVLTVDPEIFARLYFRETRVSDLFVS